MSQIQHTSLLLLLYSERAPLQSGKTVQTCLSCSEFNKGRLSRVAWTARRSNWSILKEINPEYSLEGLMVKLKLQHFGHLMQQSQLIGKDPDAGKD